MIELVRATAGDLLAIGPHAVEIGARPHFNGQIDLTPVVDGPYAWTARCHGMPLFAGGWFDCGAGAALAWALVGKVPVNLAVPLCRSYRRLLEANPFFWLETAVDRDFAVSQRWVGLLGFARLGGAPLLPGPSGRKYIRFVYRKGRS